MTQPRSAARSAAFVPPYAAGWFDRLIDWIDRLPGPDVVYCLGLLVAQFAYVTTLLWLDGKLALDGLDLRPVFAVVVAPYLLWVRFYLDRVAGAAMDAFRPLLAVEDAEFQRLRYELTTLSARTTRIVTAVAIVLFLVNALLLPDAVIQQYGTSFGAALIVVGPVGLFTLPVVAVSTFQALHQLRMVERIHGLVGEIALLRAKSLYVFSQLTALTGASFLLLTYYVAAVRPDLLARSRAMEVLILGMVPTAIACFVLPLRGMHRRLAAEKDRVLDEVASRLEIVFARLHERVDQDVLADADKINLQITSLTAERAALERVSTWPWEPATLTGFVTTLLLPAVLWGLQHVMERFGF